MALGTALRFPLLAKNLSKIFSFILIYVILIASVMVLGLLTNTFTLARQVASFISFAYSLFVSGYTIEVIKQVMAGDDTLPAPMLGRDIKRGFLVGLAGLLHFAPIFILFVFAMITGSGVEFNDSSSNDTSTLTIYGLILFIIVFGFFAASAFLVGMLRFAVEDRVGTLFDVGKNLSFVRSNIRKLLGLYVLSICVSVIYGILAFMVSRTINSQASIATTVTEQIEFGLMSLFVLENVFTRSLSLIGNISIAHLQANFALDTGLGSGKAKKS